MELKKNNIILGAILCAALFVRVWGINFGLPEKYFNDEQHLVYWVFYSASHALRPVYYLYAPLVPTLLLIEYTLYYCIGLLYNFWSPSQFFIAYLSDPTVFLLVGRLTVVATGIASVWVLYLLGKNFFNNRVGLISSFFLALIFLHTKESHYIKQDVIMGFFVLDSFYFVLAIAQKNKMRDYVWCGVFFACALATKYHSVLFLVVIFVVHFLATRKLISNKLVIFGFTFFIVFCAINPYFVLEPKTTVTQAFSLAAASRIFYPEHLAGKPVWWWYMFEHIPQGIGYLLYGVSFLGFILCVVRAQTKKYYILVPLLPLLFFSTIDLFTKMHFARYGVMVVPFFALGAALFIDAIGYFFKNAKLRNIFLVLTSVILIFQSLVRTITYDFLMTRPDTRTEGKKWIEKAVMPGSKILVESTLRPEYPSILNTPLVLDTKGIEKRIKDANELNLPAQYLRSLKNANQNKIGYNIVATEQVGAKMSIFTNEETPLSNVDYYVDSGVAYIVRTSWAQDKITPEFEKSLEKHYQLIKEFHPTYEFTTDPHVIRMDYTILDKVSLWRSDIVFGPIISIYQYRSK